MGRGRNRTRGVHKPTKAGCSSALAAVGERGGSSSTFTSAPKLTNPETKGFSKGKQKKGVFLPNTTAGQKFADIVRRVYGPYAKNQTVIKHIVKLSESTDPRTKIPGLNLKCPAAKIMKEESENLEKDVPDGPNFVIVFTGALLESAKELYRMGKTCDEIIEGYNLGLEQGLKILDTLCVTYENQKDVEKDNVDAEAKEIKTEDLPLPEWLQNLKRRFKDQKESTIEPAKILVYTKTVGAVECIYKNSDRETMIKNFHTHLQLIDYEVDYMKLEGANAILAFTLDDFARYILSKYDLMGINIGSRLDLFRIARASGATPFGNIRVPLVRKEFLGVFNSVVRDVVGDTSVIIFKLKKEDSQIETIVAEERTKENVYDRVDPSENVQAVPSAGATEIELAREITAFARDCPCIHQLTVKTFGKALEVFPRTLAEFINIDPDKTVKRLYQAHKKGKKAFGVDIFDGEDSMMDTADMYIFDHYLAKKKGLEYAVAAVSRILKIDQNISGKA